MNKRKILSLAMALSIVAIMAVGATLAYFTDSDSKTNTFTVGNVDIHIDEHMVDEGKAADEPNNWEKYTDEQHLNPIAQSKAPFNKLVETVNDGSEEAYIRTFVTCPKDMYWAMGLGFNSGSEAKTLKDEDGNNIYALTSWKDAGTFTIKGEETSVFVCEYTGKVAKNESILSLTKVWLYDSVTNEDIKSYGLQEDAFKVLVASEAIQAANLSYEEAMTELGAIDQAKMDKLFK